MNNKNLWTVLIVSLVIVAFGAGMFTGILINSGPSANSNIESYEFLNRAVKSALGSYFTELNDEMLAKALLHGLDPWSTYFTKEEFSNFTEATTGVYFGIGVMISLDDTRQYARCTRIFKSSPAEDAGLSEGWLIKAVNGEEVVGVSLDLVVSKIKGPEGTTVDITFLDDGVEITKTITRAKIIADSVFTRQLEHNIAYIELMSFMPESPKEMRVALDIAMQKGSKKFILDLRNNTGGLLSSCQLIANQFLEEGPLVHVVDKSGKKQTMRTTGTRFPYDLVVLTNRWSASASEILAGAFQDRDVATIIGTRTFGKGLVQQIFPSSDGSAIKLSIQQYLTPKEHQVHGYGIKPDIDMSPDPYLFERIPENLNDDLVVKRAIEFLMQGE